MFISLYFAKVCSRLLESDIVKNNPHYAANLQKLASRDLARSAELEQVERHAFANFSGSLDELESALGMLRLGDHVGWKVLVLIHSKRTLRKYEDILGIRVREFFTPEGPGSDRSIGYKLVKKIGNFWKAVSGDQKIEGRRELGES